MLSQWRLSNFKAAGRQLDIELKPLTLIAGANSSGKSTLLQSILLLVQTLRSRASDRPIILNGDLIKLGDYSDIKSIQTDQQEIVVEFVVQTSPDRSSIRTLKRRLRPEQSSSGATPIRGLADVEFSISFDGGGRFSETDDSHTQPRLCGLKILAAYAPDQSTDRTGLLLGRREHVGGGADALNEAGTIAPLVPIGFAGIEPTSDDDAEIDREVVGTKMFHFLPERFVVSYKAAEYLASAIKSAVLSGRIPTGAIRSSASEESLFGILITPDVLDVILKHLPIGDPMREELDTLVEVTIRRLADMRRRTTNPRERRVLVESVDDESLVKELMKVVEGHHGNEPIILQRPMPEEITDACREAYDFFTSFVRYVGPLRDEPKAIYPLSSNADSRDVGLKGEATAAVFNRFRKEKVQFVTPEAFAAGSLELTPQTQTLEQGVMAWLKYLGVAKGVRSKDRSKFGHELKVQMADNEQGFDLSHVGVGVSQLLPIVVSCLLAKKGSLLIFEQPELHLHPKVQTLLGDFFVAAAASGRQCIIETHSEYIINRLRLRIASSSGTTVADLAKVYFVEQDGKGNAVYRAVDINEFGAVLDWPEGFFDQSHLEAENIVREAAKKRSKKIQPSS